MSIPEFPQSKQITLEDKPLFDEALRASPPELSAYTFTNLFAWREPYALAVSRIGEQLVLWRGNNGRTLFEPLGPGDKASTIRTLLDDSGVGFVRVHSKVAEAFANDRGFTVESDRNNADYLYRSSDLIELPGRKYDAKRNFINRFEPGSYEYVVVDEDVARECDEFAQQWCDERVCDTVEGLRDERIAIDQMLSNFSALGIVGGAIRMDGRVVAFSLGEALNPDTFVVHVEKADPAVDGLYQLINNEFCKREAHSFEYVNREQDLGIQGLRKAKQSYHPVRMVESFAIRRA